MQGFAISLREDGLFEACSADPARPSIRIVCDVHSAPCPWLAIAPDETGVSWVRIGAFPSLDEALDFAAAEAFMQPGAAYEVRLPDGVCFHRPGRVGAEQVMASSGWLYVSALIGFSMATTAVGASSFEARAIIRSQVEGTQAILGEVCPTEEDEEGMHWCADIMLPYEGFIRIEEIEPTAREAFAAEGIDVMPHFDFRTRTSLRSSGATVIPFPPDRIRKRQSAA